MMRNIAFAALAVAMVGSSVALSAADQSPRENSLTNAEKAAGWRLLFDGKSLSGWKASENPESFAVRDGTIVAQGRGAVIEAQAPHPKSHLFYVGPDCAASFKDFELQVDVKAERLANSGVYFHTEFIADAWPQKGFKFRSTTIPHIPNKPAACTPFRTCRKLTPGMANGCTCFSPCTVSMW